MPAFRKKPIVIEACQYVPGMDKPDWLLDAFKQGAVTHQPETGCLIIQTMEGPMRAKLTDWIIRGIKHELYPCDHDVFVKTYEAVQ